MNTKPSPRNIVSLIIPSNPKYLRALRSLVNEVTGEMGFAAKARAEVVRAVDEACTNVIRHSYGGDFNKKIVVILKEKSDRLEVTIKDFGRKVHPARIRHRPLHNVKPGGLGVFFIKQSMDVVCYDTSPPAGTELKMVKYLKTGGRPR